jgi:asparagine synthase (glutamine-hydrolysing)
MLESVEHRGPDDWGMAYFGFPLEERAGDSGHVTWQNTPGRPLALGHRRLSILDLSPWGRQPMTTPDGAFTITFNGEIYNYIELRAELSPQAAFRTGTDTEVLLEGYRQWGTGMLPRLDGMFAFALWDARAGKLICARDPLGIKPFYYSDADGLFLFGSEPRAVLAGLGSSGHVDVKRIAEFLVLGLSDHDEGTSYREVRQLPPGHWLEVGGDGSLAESRAYWRPGACGPDEPEDVPARVREQLDLAIRRQMRSDVPVGSCLSGGLDSASIISSVGAFLGSCAGDFTALTLTNTGAEEDESEMACMSARRAGVRWVQVQPDVESIGEDLAPMIRRMGEPFSTLSMFAQYKVMQKARQQGLKVMLDGQGGDEVFLGYPRVAQRVIGEYLKQGQLPSALHEWRALSQNASQPLVTSLLGNVFFSSPQLARWRNRRRIRGLVDASWLEQTRPEVAGDFFTKGGVTGLQVRELTRYVLPRLLRYEDRNSMAFGLEARVPLLSVGLVEMMLRLPLHWKVRNGWTKYALRLAMKDRLPEEILWHRRKRGFEVPQRRWLQAVRPQLAEWLADLPSESPVNATELLSRLDAGQGSAPWLWRCLSTTLWMRFSGVRV